MPQWTSINKRLQHLRKISRLWWVVLLGTWSVFWAIDQVISKFGSDGLKNFWKTVTLHFTFGWQAWLIGFLLISLWLIVEGSYRYKEELLLGIDKLCLPDNRPQLLFESWGEVPHDHPDARFHETRDSIGGCIREYFERGITLKNDGETTAHEIYLFPIELARSVWTYGSDVAKIEAKCEGFLFVNMNCEANVKFTDEIERWNLAKVMGVLEEKSNATKIGNEPLVVEVGVRYRNANEAWYVSAANMVYRRDSTRITFGPTKQISCGTKCPEL